MYPTVEYLQYLRYIFKVHYFPVETKSSLEKFLEFRFDFKFNTSSNMSMVCQFVESIIFLLGRFIGLSSSRKVPARKDVWAATTAAESPIWR